MGILLVCGLFLQLMVAETKVINCFEVLKIAKNNDVIHNHLDVLIYRLLLIWNVQLFLF